MSGGKVLVTGAAGFIGKHLIASLLEQGRQVCAVTRPGGTELPRHLLESVELVEVDLRDRNFSSHIFEGVDTVFHLAGLYLSGNGPSVRKILRAVNVDCTRRVVEAAQKASVRRFFHFSSIATCERSNNLVIDEMGGIPVSAYGLSKKESEEIMTGFDWSPLRWTILRPVVVFGEDHEGPITRMAQAIQRRRFVIFGDGSNRMNFMYVKDLVAAVLLAERHESTMGKVYILADEALRLGELTDILCGHIGLRRSPPRIPLVVGKVIAAVCDTLSAATGRDMPLSSTRLGFLTRDVVYSSQRFVQDTGFQPSFSVRTGIERTLCWCKQNGMF